MNADLVALADMGAKLRSQGLSLRLRALRHGLAAGEVDGRRVGSRWFLSEAEAKKFADPLPPAQQPSPEAE